jgi:perosamine synthetase
MPEMGGILAVARRRGVAVIEDAAEAIGSEYRGRKAGSFGLTSTFSFHGSKTLTTGEGGMLVTDDEAAYQRCLVLRDHGRPAGDRMFWNEEIAYKYKMSSMQAALGLAQLERIEELIDRKRQIFAWYQDALGDIEGVRLNAEPDGVKNTYWMVTVVLDAGLGLTKADLMPRMAARSIDCRPFFHPLSSIPAYADLPQAQAARLRNVHAYAVAPYGINLPSSLSMTPEKVGYVAECLKEILTQRCAG